MKDYLKPLTYEDALAILEEYVGKDGIIRYADKLRHTADIYIMAGKSDDLNGITQYKVTEQLNVSFEDHGNECLRVSAENDTLFEDLDGNPVERDVIIDMLKNEAIKAFTKLMEEAKC